MEPSQHSFTYPFSARKTYPYTPVTATSHQVNVVKLQGCDRTRMADQASVNHSAPQIPQSYHAISRAASKRRVEHLKRTDKIGFCALKSAPGWPPPASNAASRAQLATWRLVLLPSGSGRCERRRGRSCDFQPPNLACLDAASRRSPPAGNGSPTGVCWYKRLPRRRAGRWLTWL